jgi:predicted thioesterase
MDRKRLTFQVEAYFGEIIIGSGSYEQFVIELEKFMNI